MPSAQVAGSEQLVSGDTVSLRQTSASAPLSKTSATLTVAGYSAAFDVTTLKADEAIAIPTLSEWVLLLLALLVTLLGARKLGRRYRGMLP